MSQRHYLYLYCTDLDYFPVHREDFIRSCQDYGLLSKPYDSQGENLYLVGDHFLQHISFLGCSPYLKVYPENDQDSDFCSAVVPVSTTPVQFLSSQQKIRPRCPACKKSLPPIDTMLEDWRHHQSNKSVTCPTCNATSALYTLDWRKNAGFINFHIAISNIFPKEAIPGEALLNWLKSISESEWKYFYV